MSAHPREWFRRAQPPESASDVRAGPRMAAERFAELTAPFHARLFDAALAMSRDADVAADLTQETLLKAFEARDRLRTDVPSYPWLLRIVRNLFVDQRRSAAWRREIRVDAPPEIRDPARDPLSALIVDEKARRLREAIAELPHDVALTVTLVDVQGLSYEEVAEATEVPVGTVRSRLSRGRNRLLQRLRREAEQEERLGKTGAPDEDRNRLAAGARPPSGRP